MTGRQQSRTDRRVFIAVAAQLVAVVLGLAAFYEMRSAGLLTAQFDPAWWSYPALFAAVIASLYSFGTFRGWLHTAERTPEEIIEEVTDGER